MKPKSNIEIFQSSDGKTEVSVTFDNETVWLNQEQLSQLFERDRTVVGQHIKNIFREGELEEDVVCAKIAHTTQHGAIEGKTQTKTTQYYNLDVIISVGYRVKSLRGTQFRQWANQRLKDYLIKGYAINQKRLDQTNEEIQILRSGIQIIGRAIEEKALSEGLDWLENYSKGLKLLDDYDHESLDSKGRTIKKFYYPSRKEYLYLIDVMKTDFESDVLSVKKDAGFESATAQITKGFDNSDFYPSLEEKAAMLLYLVY